MASVGSNLSGESLKRNFSDEDNHESDALLAK